MDFLKFCILVLIEAVFVWGSPSISPKVREELLDLSRAICCIPTGSRRKCCLWVMSKTFMWLLRTLHSFLASSCWCWIWSSTLSTISSLFTFPFATYLKNKIWKTLIQNPNIAINLNLKQKCIEEECHLSHYQPDIQCNNVFKLSSVFFQSFSLYPHSLWVGGEEGLGAHEVAGAEHTRKGVEHGLAQALGHLRWRGDNLKCYKSETVAKTSITWMGHTSKFQVLV